jgi:hypothetical protein
VRSAPAVPNDERGEIRRLAEGGRVVTGSSGSIPGSLSGAADIHPAR